MDSRADIIEQLKIFRKNLEKRIHVDRVIFFGSRVSGGPRGDSDIDLIIVSEDFAGKRFRHRPLGFYDYWMLEYPVDFLCYTTEEFDKLKDQVTIVRDAVETGIEIG